MIDKIKASLKDGTFFRKVIGKFKFIYHNIARKTFEDKIEINPKKVMFITFQGDYNCNPKAICDEFIREKKDYELVWVCRKESDKTQYPKEVKLVRRQTIEFYKEAASAKFIIDNANNFEYLHMKKKKGQYLFQPWHGAMGFKKLDASAVKNDNWVNKALMMDEITDFCITNSKFEEEVFKTSYWPHTPFLKYGHPRNDMLFDNNGEFYKYTKKVKERYNIPRDTKIALYAPTFRDNSSIESYNLDYLKLKNALEKKFGGNWVVLLRFHFKLRSAKIPKKYLNNVVNVTDYPDMQELLCACDLGITDYSSWMCDYVLTRRPGFLFVSDLKDYKDERGFYYPLTSTPFKVCETTEELVDAIKKYDEKTYQKEVDKFLKDRGCYEDGKASSKVVKKIEELSKKN